MHFLEGVLLTDETFEPFPPPEGKVGPSASSTHRDVKMHHGNKGSQLFSKAQIDMPRLHLGERDHGSSLPEPRADICVTIFPSVLFYSPSTLLFSFSGILDHG